MCNQPIALKTYNSNMVMKNDVILLAFLVFCISAFIFIAYEKYKDNKYVTWDGYVYLVYSKSVLTQNALFLDSIRSPLLSLVIPPNLEVARIMNCIYLLLCSVIVFLLVKKLTGDPLLGFLGGVLTGINPYLLFFTSYTLSDLPAVLFFLAGLLFYFDKRKAMKIVAGILFGFSFVFRPDMAIPMLPFFLFKIKDRSFLKFCVVPFFSIAFALNFLVSSLVFSKPIYPPLQFVLVNFVTEKMAFITQTTSFNDYLWFLKHLISYNTVAFILFAFSLRYLTNLIKNEKYKLVFISFLLLTVVHFFLPKIDSRIYVTKAIPLTTTLAPFAFRNERKQKLLVFSLALVIIMLHLFLLLTYDPPLRVWRIDQIDYKKDGIICSNIPFVYIYFAEKVPCHLIKYFQLPIEKRDINPLRQEIELNGCEYLYIFTHPNFPLAKKEIKALSQEFNVKTLSTGNDFYPVYEVSVYVHSKE